MRRFFLPFCFLFIPSGIHPQVVLNEVYYDHPGLDGGYEFIELINLTPVAVGLAGYSLEFHDGNSSGWKIIWRASLVDSIQASKLFVIGGSDVFPPPDTVITLALQNGPDAVRLVKDGIGVDRLGYGELVDPVYFEGHSAPDVPAGFSLARWPDGNDTDDNAADYRVLYPSPMRFNRPRHDIALSPGSQTSLRKSLSIGRTDVIGIRIHNRGTEPVFETLRIRLIDSTQTSVDLLEVRDAFGPLAAGDSVEVVFQVELGHGYHTLTAVAVYALDERPADNLLDILRRVGSPPVLVSEVMSHPAAGCPEYIEFYNGGSAPYDIGGHWIRDRVSSPALIASSTVPIAPGHFVVVTQDKAALRSWFPGLTDGDVIEMKSAWPSLNHATGGNEADSVILSDSFLLTVDRVSYPAQPRESRGRSLERVDLYPGDGVHVWLLSSAAGGGSPARANPLGILEEPRGGRLSLSSNPFDPTAGEPLLITIPARAGPSGAIVGLFDIRGRRVRDIGTTTQLPFVFAWDGTDDHGRLVTPGVYVVACEYAAWAGGRGSVEKVVLGCAQRIR